MLDDVARTHPYLATTDGRHVINDRYTRPEVFLTNRDRLILILWKPLHPSSTLFGASANRGIGLWLTHQLCSLVTLDKLKEGFTIRLIAGQL